MRRNRVFAIIATLLLVLMVASPLAAAPSAAGQISANGEIGTYISGGRNVMADKYIHSEGYPPFADKASFIGTLSGDWYSMGKQYGGKSGENVRIVSDLWWKEQCDAWGKKETLKAMAIYEEQIKALDPNLIEFMKGITDGASPWLNKSIYNRKDHPLYSTNYERVLAVNVYDEWTMCHPSQFPDGSSTFGGATKPPSWNEPEGGGSCSGFGAFGKATLNGETIMAHNRQTPQDPRDYQQVYIIDPPDGYASWVLSNSPQVAANQVVNEKGVSVSLFFGGQTNPRSLNYEGGPYHSEDFGVSWFTLLLYIATHAENAEQAIEMLTVGPAGYLERTGRNSILLGGGWIFMVSDENTTAVVERTADRYAVRYPGDNHKFTGKAWTGIDYIVVANINLCDFSYDENNKRTDVPMTVFGCGGYTYDDQGKVTGFSSSGMRFWTLMWDLKNNYGKVDRYMAQHIMSGYHGYDKEGNKLSCAQDEKGNWLPYGMAKECNQGWSVGPMFGTNDGKIAILDGLNSVVYWTLGNPGDWQGAWDEYRFKR
ncbi:MAG TPA: hypothetical protein GXZ24_02300 [Firmicutes bacterium]|nr:hypothetical protein [Bacillota bacterium]